MNIGDWITRERRPARAHLVESIVSGDAVTRCGRRMTDEPTRTGGRLVTADYGTLKCLHCVPATETSGGN